MTKKKDKSLQLNRYATINHRTINEDKRQVELSFSSEEPYERWFGLEILSHTDGALDLTRLNEIGCLLYNHNRDKVIGRIDNAWVEGNRGYALVTFDDDPDSDVIYQKVKSGTLKGVSVGYRVDSWEEVSAGKASSDGRFTGPCSIALKWLPFEISIVSIPADATVGVGRELGDELVLQKGEVPLSIYYKQLQLNQNILEVNGK
ncbi:HK97 family phage prohead protease [Bacillus sp. B-jedd]|uniref:HK97 family phage prohead protease n=1 Tax=Bacillus sp. B-jedd TaxID=1476857 RepID=UPI0005156496|nr:HK97 family phage prohead protease [Bacillus sp. B-jedd]CEG29806.1 Caudovirus prohead protease [Bacillus sp. B-jedd]